MAKETSRDLPAEGRVRTAWIITGGHCRPDVFRRYPARADLVIAADAGRRTAEAASVSPDLVCGDFDSSAPPHGVRVVRVPAEKDDTDTMLACELAAQAGAEELVLFGGTGGRIDHSLSNLFWLEALRRRGIRAILTDGDNRVRLLENESLRLAPDGFRYFSLLALTEATVSLHGCKYPLTDAPLCRALSYAVSNEITSAFAEIKVSGGPVLLIESDCTL